MSTDLQEIESVVKTIAVDAREASLALANVSTEKKNKAILRLAELIEENVESLRTENAKDLAAAENSGISGAMLNRLQLNDSRIAGMIEGARQVAALPDPVGESLDIYKHPQGFTIEKVRVPIGVIGIIYESRPNVTVDCAILCLKSGNASILRGGKEAFHTNTALAALVSRALDETGLPTKAVQFIPTTDRAALNTLLKLQDQIQCIIPRGGEGLIRFVSENSTIPVIKHYDGICTLFVDQAADIDMATKIVVNSKTHYPSVCNAGENLLVDRSIAASALPVIAKALKEKGVELRADADAKAILVSEDIPCVDATEEDWGTEYLDLIISIKIVDSVEEAMGFINHYGSSHSDCIITGNPEAATQFLNGVDSSTVYWNVSTRFTDGFEFGLGAEIGISTDRLHARGPMGLRELCSYKYKVVGEGQIKA
ncbi:glutamate-5-semialdehyde dehydrogenase [Pelagicoccus sp. SDUM812003]|uniref:glutamate-5-semialdehyde dehydrogenase n=1 Tax=Pelagicoccus sp. SDUM812003 TaxID=3041267 RepID=UPI00280D4EE2|nr:glutamate-5-semialdehyde dehydrogenase [Pelagicoccus sp. SDUM812003]MDQ8203537.1 glutamate-5-semialdehyde dehydrogenase [Pelagicoccus sp. SDUM812003]